jgi:hypothetical protein
VRKVVKGMGKGCKAKLGIGLVRGGEAESDMS